MTTRREAAQHASIVRLREGRPSVTLPGTRTKINLPDRQAVLWYAGITAMAAIDLIEWPVALLVAGTHFIENHAHNRDIQELAEGIESGA
jgi:hypothetical protein